MFKLDSFKQGHWPVFFISLISAITNLFLPIVLVRMLTPHDVGVYKIFFLYAQSVIYFSLSAGPLYSVYYWIGKKEDREKYIEHAWLLCIILCFATAIVGFIFVTPLSSYISLSRKQTVLLVLSAISTAPSTFLGEYWIAVGKRVAGSIFNGGFEILKVLTIIIVVYYTKSIDVALWTFTFLFLLKTVLAIWIGVREGILTKTIQPDFLRKVWSYCAPLSYGGILAFFVEKFDMIVLSSKLDSVSFAFYSMGCLSIPPLMLLEMSVQKVLIPELSKQFHDHNYKTMIEKFKKAQLDISIIMIPAVFGLMYFNRPIVELLFTKEFMKSADYLLIFSVTYFAYALPHDSILRATNESKKLFKLYIFLAPISLVSVYTLTHFFGAFGALSNAIFFLFLPRLFGLHWSAKKIQTNIWSLFNWKMNFFFVFVNIVLILLSGLVKHLFVSDLHWFYYIGPLYGVVYLLIVQRFKRHFI